MSDSGGGVRWPWPPHAEPWPPWPDSGVPNLIWHCHGTTGDFRCAHILSEPPSVPTARVRPAAGSLYSLWQSGQTSATRLRSSDSASPSDPPARWWVRRSQLLEAGTERRSGWSGRCMPESIQRIFWIDIELGKNILQCTDESIFLPTSTIGYVQVIVT